MRTLVFTKRCLREVFRDPITLFFGAGFPVIILLLLSVMNLNIPAEAQMTMFDIENLLPGVIVFGFSFLALFGGMLLAGDRETAFLMRLFTSPLRARDFIAGYSIPLFPVGLAQAVLCVIIGFIFGLSPTIHILTMLLFFVPTILLFVGIGLLLGSLLNFRQVGSICGALLTNVAAWLSGTWFSLDLLGKGFKTFAYCLPFANAVDAARAALAGDLAGALGHIWIVCIYALAACTGAVLLFRKKMKV
jgi:ABC-2 type transport system permease protein